MSEQTANGNGHKGILGRTWGFAKRHPFIAATTAVGTAWFAGAELLAAAIVGGVVAKALGGGRQEPAHPETAAK